MSFICFIGIMGVYGCKSKFHQLFALPLLYGGSRLYSPHIIETNDTNETTVNTYNVLNKLGVGF